MEEKNQSLLYFAYGEHMNENEMTRLFPHARMMGKSRLPDYCLSFVGRDGMARAALLPRRGHSVPGRLWSLQASDADILDRDADAPHFARPELYMFDVEGMTVPALVYITVPGQPSGRPGFVTYDLMREAYEAAGESLDTLRQLAMQCAPS
ncbi:gamma-glutamylcyclotransferase [Eubacteriales bacterium OttesenSCG-928-A19]|nr:gamma-glutamylcyclotransferase [Eubacteriales bacterium OttesenSCG-928-A19]